MLEEKVAADHKKQCNEFKLACDAAVPLDVVMIGAAGAVHKRASSNPGKRAAMNAGDRRDHRTAHDRPDDYV